MSVTSTKSVLLVTDGLHIQHISPGLFIRVHHLSLKAFPTWMETLLSLHFPGADVWSTGYFRTISKFRLWCLFLLLCWCEQSNWMHSYWYAFHSFSSCLPDFMSRYPTMCSLQKQNLQPLSTFFPHLHIFHLNSVFNNKYLFLLVISKYFTCFGSLISISVAQQVDLTAILKLQTSETSVLCCKVLLAQRQGILSSRNRSWCSASVSVRWYYTGTDCDPENIRHLLLA